MTYYDQVTARESQNQNYRQFYYISVYFWAQLRIGCNHVDAEDLKISVAPENKRLYLNFKSKCL